MSKTDPCLGCGRDIGNGCDTPHQCEDQPDERCPDCDGTGNIIRFDGEWLGSCDCGATPVAESDAPNPSSTQEPTP